MASPLLHRFQIGGRRFVIDPSTCFCFECDHISWDVLEYYPREPVNRIYYLLRDKHPRKDLEEVVGELEWLRVTKAILAAPKDEELLREATERTGINKISVMATGGIAPLEERVDAAATLLLAASGTHNNLTLQLIYDKESAARAGNHEPVGRVFKRLQAATRCHGAEIQLRLSVPLKPDAAEYNLDVALREDGDSAADISRVLALSGAKARKAAAVLKREQTVSDFRLVARPNSAAFHTLLQDLYNAGYRDIFLDIPGAYAANPQIDPADMADALRANAAWYAEQLLQRRYFRAEPFASLFDAVHQGAPVRRADGAGRRELAVDGDGGVFPSPEFLGETRFRLGSAIEGRRAPEALRPFEQISAALMPACRQCWARCLCGGGHAIIHHRRTGHVNTPDPRWCDGQRLWLAHLIDAFNTLSSADVDFSHVARAIRGGKKMSWLQTAKAAYQMRLIPRPLRESDAEWLVKWENWNNAAYFTCNESGLLLATRYDREMDALHPRGMEQEFVLTRPNGAPCGLLRARPATTIRGLAWAWLYMRDKKAYEESGVRRALRTLLTEMKRSQQLAQILTPVTSAETGLATCLEALGFKRLGVRRQALYLHGKYHDVSIYSHSDKDEADRSNT
ncbi:MAG TPA: GNAT family N-acetyltransferase [Candidatus Hydrogenedentes bacterium]|nr:GNAT family N-acetyltransferase [Candidatus Hydrogenedentota bacterium]